MRKLVFYLLLATILLSCDEEGGGPVQRTQEQGCYLSEVTASNAETTKFFMQDGRLVGMGYGDIVSEAVYNYDDDGKLVSLVHGTFKSQYFYNKDGKIIRAENINDGVLISRMEWKYDAEGYPFYTLSTHDINADVQGFTETEIVYEGGNPVKTTAYLYRSNSPDKGNPLVTVTKYDDKKNPYNTIHSTVGIPIKNNPIQWDYLSDPQSKSVATYTYNEDGYPVTYNYHFPDRTDGYPDIYGEYIYDCDGD